MEHPLRIRFGIFGCEVISHDGAVKCMCRHCAV
ncbi:Protein of unknown function [Pyronema omphalodes CBS 100304]|uniref:Uncharacterized protein n=1 Tax=Pyronema omphalodes (strain CBS 100304) TaxID=1076935 RepID=U4LHX8_PYROM|nr:Protein of unknown function [Pyronema omphalodes CBS 100304]